MIKIEKTEVVGWETAIRGMRNPMNSWEKSDSIFCRRGECEFCPMKSDCHSMNLDFDIGPNDHELMMKLAKGSPVHGKYRRMIVVYLDIIAPLYWWKEFDTYKIGTVANSCSTMHKIHTKEFTADDFSHEHLDIWTIKVLEDVINVLNDYRALFVNYNADDFEIKGCPSQKDIWWQMIQLLPSSYNQKRTVMLNYEVLAGIYKHRCEHKLDEWREFCKWIETLPHSELITGDTGR